MIQILTYLLAVYLVMKGVEIFQIGLASANPDKKPLMAIGVASVVVCVGAALVLVGMQEEQAATVGAVSTPPAALFGY